MTRSWLPSTPTTTRRAPPSCSPRSASRTRTATAYCNNPDGEDVSITIWVLIGQSTWVDIVELIKKQWDEAGLKVAINAINRELFSAEGQRTGGTQP